MSLRDFYPAYIGFYNIYSWLRNSHINSYQSLTIRPFPFLNFWVSLVFNSQIVYLEFQIARCLDLSCQFIFSNKWFNFCSSNFYRSGLPFLMSSSVNPPNSSQNSNLLQLFIQKIHDQQQKTSFQLFFMQLITKMLQHLMGQPLNYHFHSFHQPNCTNCFVLYITLSVSEFDGTINGDMLDAYILNQGAYFKI